MMTTKAQTPADLQVQLAELREDLALADDDLVERLARFITLAGDLRAMTERDRDPFEHGAIEMPPPVRELLARYPMVKGPASMARKPCAFRSSSNSRSSFQNVRNFLGSFSIMLRYKEADMSANPSSIH